MKIQATIILFILLCIGSARAQSSYDLTVQTRQGEKIPFSKYHGKKILIVVLPGTKTRENVLFIKRIDSLAKVVMEKVIVIAIPSYEISNGTDSIDYLLKWFKDEFTSGIIQSIPVYTNRTSSQQDKLFHWLTHADQNGHFDFEVTGEGTMFLINELGELSIVAGPEAKFSNMVLRKMLN